MTSQHSKGQAVDLVPGAGATFTTAAIFRHILTALPFDQLIAEYPDAKKIPRWVHVSFTETARRGLVLRTTGTPDAPSYAPWKAA